MITSITNETPLAMLTVGQFMDLVKANQPQPPSLSAEADQKVYVYGLRGIRKLFNVSHATAQRYKDTIIKDAVSQNGRKIIVDADKARALFNAKSGRIEK
jgi:hypothetical protein